MNKKNKKKLAKKIGMSKRSIKALCEMGYLQENMTDVEVGLFLCQKENILDEIADGFTGFRRVKEISERLILVNKDGVIIDGFSGNVLHHMSNAICGEPAYKYVTIYIDGERKNYLVHRLVAMCFCPNEKNKPFVHHINGDRNDNRAENLIWVTLFEHHLFHKMARKKNRNFYKMFLDCVQTENNGVEWGGYFNT